MPFKLPSLSESRDMLVAVGKALFRGQNFTSRRSYHGRKATYLAAGVTQLHYHVDAAQADLHPLTAGDGKPIADWGEATGVARNPATPARKAKAARIRGNAAAPVTAGAQLQTANGLLFEITQNVTIPGMPGDDDGYYDADIAGIDVGSQTRLDAGTTLTFVDVPPGIAGQVVLQLDLDEDGLDTEQFGSYRGRVLATFSQTPSGGNQEDFAKWAIEALPTVASAFAYPNRAGRGTIDVAAFYNGSGSARALSEDDRDAVKAYIQNKTVAPFQIAGEGGGLRILETIPDPQRVEIALETNGIPAFAFYWDDSTNPTVLSWTPTTRALRFAAPLPASLRAGHTLILDGVVSVQDGREWKIESILSADTVILEQAPPHPPGPGDKIYAGGPLVTPVRDAIVAHLNGQIVYAGPGLTPLTEANTDSIIGLDVLAYGIGSANPSVGNRPRYGSWIGGILRSALFRIATYKAGVRNAVIVTPSADYEAEDDAFPNDDQIHYVTPETVIVREA